MTPTQTSTAAPEFVGQRRILRSAFAVTEATQLTAYLATCDAHRVPVREDVVKAQATTKFRMITCFISGTDHLVKGERLFEVITAEECDGSCRAARGPHCHCGCGGANHGNTWTRGKFLSSRLEVESAIERYRAELAKHEAARVKRAEKADAKRAAEFEIWASDPKIAALIAWLNGPHAFVGNFLADMISNVKFHKILSEGMIRACRDIYTREAQARRRQSELRAAAPAKPGAGDQATLTPGVYKLGAEVYVVKGNKIYLAWRKDLHAAIKAGTAPPARPAGANLYAKKLTESAPRETEAGTEIPFELVYAPGVIRSLALTDMMPLAEAEALATRYAHCIVCGRRLKAARSVREAIGPVCRGYFRQ